MLANVNTRAYPLFAGTSYPLGTSAYLPFDQTELRSPPQARRRPNRVYASTSMGITPVVRPLEQVKALEWNQHRAMNYAMIFKMQSSLHDGFSTFVDIHLTSCPELVMELCRTIL